MHVRHEALLDPPAVLVDLVQVLQLIVVAAAHGGGAPSPQLRASAAANTRPTAGTNGGRRGSNFLRGGCLEVGELAATCAPWRRAAERPLPKQWRGRGHPSARGSAGTSQGRPLASIAVAGGQRPSLAAHRAYGLSLSHPRGRE